VRVHFKGERKEVVPDDQSNIQLLLDGLNCDKLPATWGSEAAH